MDMCINYTGQYTHRLVGQDLTTERFRKYGTPIIMNDYYQRLDVEIIIIRDQRLNLGFNVIIQ